MQFVSADAADVRALDPATPILPGTMGANHVEPGQTDSAIARWLYCNAPVDAYTLHAYDWVSRQRPGDMPIDWDLDNILSQPCPNGRALPVIVEELGTSRALAGMYEADQESERVEQEKSQIEFVRHFPEVVGFGVWNAESPRLVDRTFVDTRRGLTSYGAGAQGGGSCYDPLPDPSPGARCQLEQVLRDTRFVRVNPSNQWIAGPSGEGESLVGSIDPVYAGDANADALTISGWVADPSTEGGSGIDALNIFIGNGLNDSSLPVLGATAEMGLKRDDVVSSTDNPGWVDSGFAINLPLDGLPAGPTMLTLAAHTPERGTWVSSLAVVVPDLGGVPARASAPAAPVPVAVGPLPPFHVEVASPQVGDQVSRSSTVEVLAPTADHVEVYLEPDRDKGGRLAGSSTVAPGLAHTTLKVTVNATQGGHTLYVHASSSLTGQQAVISVPVVVVR
jgi:hypothetical protein